MADGRPRSECVHSVVKGAIVTFDDGRRYQLETDVWRSISIVDTPWGKMDRGCSVVGPPRRVRLPDA